MTALEAADLSWVEFETLSKLFLRHFPFKAQMPDREAKGFLRTIGLR